MFSFNVPIVPGGQEESVSWKAVVEKLVVEKTCMKAFYEDELDKLNRKLQRGVGFSSGVVPSIP